MTLTFARILPPSESDAATWAGEPRPEAPFRTARIEPPAVVDASLRAEAIVARAEAEAQTILARAEAEAQSLKANLVDGARAEATARLAVETLQLRAAEVEADERALDRSVGFARLLAERLLGEALELDPSRIEALARRALQDASGARRIRIVAHPADAAALEPALLARNLAHVVEILADDARPRGSLRFETEIGALDADIAPQLDRLSERLREALRHER